MWPDVPVFAYPDHSPVHRGCQKLRSGYNVDFMSTAPVLHLTIEGSGDDLSSLKTLQDLQAFQGADPTNRESKKLTEKQARNLLDEDTFRVLRALLQQKGMSRGQLQGQANLGRQAAQDVVNALMDHDIVKQEPLTGVYYLPYSNIHLNADRDDIPNGKLI